MLKSKYSAFVSNRKQRERLIKTIKKNTCFRFGCCVSSCFGSCVGSGLGCCIIGSWDGPCVEFSINFDVGFELIFWIGL